jgi:hypothetical protein
MVISAQAKPLWASFVMRLPALSDSLAGVGGEWERKSPLYRVNDDSNDVIRLGPNNANCARYGA